MINMEADGDSEENRRQSSISFREGENKESSFESITSTPKVPKKFINNWRQACDRTKDRTKELLKKWRTLPEGTPADLNLPSEEGENNSGNANWSEHIWNTWVKRSPSGEDQTGELKCLKLTETQTKKFGHFFISYFDLDRDDVISLADFDAFAERIRHFSDWSKSSPEYHRLKEVQRGFIETFLMPDNLESPIYSYELLEIKLKKEQMSLEQWLEKWTSILNQGQSFYSLPLWLQYLPKILFNAINRSESGAISKQELSVFFSSILGLSSIQIEPFAEEAYKSMTSNNQHPLTYPLFRLCFANFIFGRYPNGPGQYIFGPIAGIENAFFPIDYKTLNSDPKEIEQYSPLKKSNRRSVVV